MSVALVTGGAGFLGSHLVRLILSGDPQAGIPPSRDYSLVRVLDLRPFDIDAALSNATAARQALSKAQPMSNTTDNITCSAAVATDTATPVDDVNLTISRVESMVGSVSDMETVRRAVAGVDVVFHVAALVDWGQASYDALFTANVVGTQNVIQACREAGVRRLVYSSTMDVVCWRAAHTIDARDEDLAIPPRRQDFLYGDYAITKAEAELNVTAADSPALHTVSIRCTGMFGEGDPHHLPNLMKAARGGQLLLRMGREFFADFVRAAGVWMPPAWLYMPAWLTMLLAHIMVWLASLLSLFGVHWLPSMTPGAVVGVLHSHGFAGNLAGPELGYDPIVSHEEGRRRTLLEFIQREGLDGKRK